MDDEFDLQDTTSDYFTSDLKKRNPDKWNHSINWRLVVLIIVGISIIQIL